MARLTKPAVLTDVALFGAARQLASRWLPYLSKGLYRMREKPIEGMAIPGAYPIAMTAGGVMIWDPKFWARKSPKMLAAAMLHELGHWLRNHHGRRGDRDPQQWNLAGDCAIDDDLLPVFLNTNDLKNDKEVMNFINTWVYPSKYGLPDGQLEEYYYAKLPKHDAPQGAGREQGGSDDHDHGDGQSEYDNAGKSVRKVCCGSASGNAHPQEAEIDKEIGHTTYGVESIRRAVAEDVKAHFKSVGTEPNGWMRWAETALLPPKVRWQDVAARLIRRTLATRRGHGYYSYEMPSRRQAAYGIKPGSIVQPARVMPEFNLWVAIDTSGSMDLRSELVRCVSELQGILKQVAGAKVTFCTVDTDVYDVVPVKTVLDAVRGGLKGGGGTDFRSLFEMLQENRTRPCHLLIVLTDGYAFVPDEAPPFPTIWGLVGAQSQTPAEWGVVVQIDVEEKNAA